MAFRFPLAALLHFRQSVEHQQELRLRAANQHVARIRHLIEQIEQHIRETESHRSQQLGAGTNAVELHFSLFRESSLREQIPQLQQELARFRTLRDQQQRIYQQARREREILENLRDRQQQEYERDATRREQRELDDLFLLRQAYLRQSR
jgi:flagellar export protein FliJ